jgi:hypothetical protein
MSLMSRSRMSSPFLSSRASIILCASSSAFRYHLIIMSLRGRWPEAAKRPPSRGDCFVATNAPRNTCTWRKCRCDMVNFLTVRNITLYTPGLLIANHFYTGEQSLLWLCRVSQSLFLPARVGSSVDQRRRYAKRF